MGFSSRTPSNHTVNRNVENGVHSSKPWCAHVLPQAAKLPPDGGKFARLRSRIAGAPLR
ncbi:MAG: hypothetical protein MR364_01610 [Oscillospiraceae bacterium]|nr:hypothetical protein [Oscillospiraceae bacterium]